MVGQRTEHVLGTKKVTMQAGGLVIRFWDGKNPMMYADPMAIFAPDYVLDTTEKKTPATDVPAMEFGIVKTSPLYGLDTVPGAEDFVSGVVAEVFTPHGRAYADFVGQYEAKLAREAEALTKLVSERKLTEGTLADYRDALEKRIIAGWKATHEVPVEAMLTGVRRAIGEVPSVQLAYEHELGRPVSPDTAVRTPTYDPTAIARAVTYMQRLEGKAPKRENVPLMTPFSGIRPEGYKPIRSFRTG